MINRHHIKIYIHISYKYPNPHTHTKMFTQTAKRSKIPPQTPINYNAQKKKKTIQQLWTLTTIRHRKRPSDKRLRKRLKLMGDSDNFTPRHYNPPTIMIPGLHSRAFRSRDSDSIYTQIMKGKKTDPTKTKTFKQKGS